MTKWVTIGASRPGAPAPASFDDAMTSPTSQEFVFVSCIDASICNFGSASMTTFSKSPRMTLSCTRSTFLRVTCSFFSSALSFLSFPPSSSSFSYLFVGPQVASLEAAPPKDHCAVFANCTACIDRSPFPLILILFLFLFYPFDFFKFLFNFLLISFLLIVF